MNPDRALLASVIARCQPHVDGQAIAERLLDAYGSLGPVLESDPEDLWRLTGMPDAATQLLSVIPQLARYVACEQAAVMKNLGSFARAGAYLRRLYIGSRNECFYLMCLDGKGMLLDCPLVQRGTVDEAPFYLRRILELTLRSGASAVVLSHNHPSGSPHYSKGDIHCTHQALEALAAVDVALLDHILVADGRPYSLYGNSDFPETLLTRQHPGDPLIAGWLRDEEDCP